MKKITLAFLLCLLSAFAAFGAPPLENVGVDNALRSAPAGIINPAIWRNAMDVFSKAEANASFSAIDGSNIIATSAFRANLGIANHSKITVDSAGGVTITGNASDTLAAVSSTAKAGLDVWNGGPSMLLGGELGVNTRANGANKYGHILMVPNNTAARPWLPMRLYSSGTNNAMTLGGGNGLYNSATLIDFNTGANVTTLTGTTRMEINARGAVLIASTTDDGVNTLQVHGLASFAGALKMGDGTCIATTTPMPGYSLTVASGAWFGHDVSAETFTDRSAAPNTLDDAYAIVQSHESKNGKVDHSKLSSLAWGTKSRIVPTGRMISKTITTTIAIPLEEREAVEEGKEAPTTREVETVIEEPETVVETVPDSTGRNLSIVISAQAMVIQDLEKRLKVLEAK